MQDLYGFHTVFVSARPALDLRFCRTGRVRSTTISNNVKKDYSTHIINVIYANSNAKIK